VATHYEALDLPADASAPEIKKAWRKIAFECHPDRSEVRGVGTSEEGAIAERFKLAMMAWEILGDEAARAAYDKALRKEGREARRGARAAHVQAYGDQLWQEAQAAQRALEKKFMRQAHAKALRAAKRKRAQAERRAAERQRAADQVTMWEEAQEAYLQKIVSDLRCEIASFLLDDR
jgi:curved DNA-binding protein CbpA